MQQRKIGFLESPIVLAPIAGPGTPELTAAAANAGAFAFLACAYSHPAKMRRDIARVRELTDKPFGFNLFIEQEPADVALELLVRADHHDVDPTDHARVRPARCGSGYPDASAIRTGRRQEEGSSWRRLFIQSPRRRPLPACPTSSRGSAGLSSWR